MKSELRPLTLAEAIEIAGGSPSWIVDGIARLGKETIQELSCHRLSLHVEKTYGWETKEYREFICLFAWLKSLREGYDVTYPLEVEKAEAPDFLISLRRSNSVLAVEQVDACCPLSREIDAAVRRDGHARLIPSPGAGGALASDKRGWVGDEPLHFFASELKTAVLSKIGSCWRNAPDGARQILLVGDATTPKHWIDDATAMTLGKRVVDGMRPTIPDTMCVFLVRGEGRTSLIS